MRSARAIGCPVEIGAQWTAFGRGNQLPESVRLKGGRTVVLSHPSRKGRGLDGALTSVMSPRLQVLAWVTCPFRACATFVRYQTTFMANWNTLA